MRNFQGSVFIQIYISVPLNSIKDEQKMELLKKERKTMMTQIQNIIKNDKKVISNQIYFRRPRRKQYYVKNSMKMYKAVQNIKRVLPKERLIVKTKEGRA